MGTTPKINKKPKYNKNDAFRWVDSQWEKFMTEQKEHKAIIKQLQEDLATCTENYQKLRGTYRGDDWRIEQFNRNKSPEDQVKTIDELEMRIKKDFK